MQNHWRKCDVVNLFMGFPKKHKVVDGYSRCRLCSRDIPVASRVLSAMKEHWSTSEHQRLDTRYRLDHGLPLLDKSDNILSGALYDEQAAKAEGVVNAVMEATYGISLETVIELEKRERDNLASIDYSAFASLSMSTERAERLWFAKVVECLRSQRCIGDATTAWQMIQSCFSEFSYLHDLPCDSTRVLVCMLM